MIDADLQIEMGVEKTMTSLAGEIESHPGLSHRDPLNLSIWPALHLPNYMAMSNPLLTSLQTRIKSRAKKLTLIDPLFAKSTPKSRSSTFIWLTVFGPALSIQIEFGIIRTSLFFGIEGVYVRLALLKVITAIYSIFFQL